MFTHRKGRKVRDAEKETALAVTPEPEKNADDGPNENQRMFDELTKKKEIDWFLIGWLGVLFFSYVLIHDLTNRTLLAPNVYDSYTLQAVSWLNGRCDVPADYTWLELAIYDGHYYVSFPPVPSLIMLPLAAAFGTNAPSNLVLAVVTITAVAFCYECFLKNGTRKRSAMFWALFCIMGSNMLWMSTKGGVWFMAQGFNLMFLTAALWAYLCRRDILAMCLAALAVGCRPFSVCFCTALLILILLRAIREHGRKQGILRTLLTIPIPAAIAVWMLAYNYVRFDNAFEFGHNYLPEFTDYEGGQFSLEYVGRNAFNLLLLPPKLTEELGVDIPSFDGFMFYVANPLFIVYFVLLVRDAVKKEFSRANGIMFIALCVNLFLLTLHKTLGGWQFGARYTVDLLPYAIFTLLEDRTGRPNDAELLLGAAAILFNIYGIFFMVIREGFV